MSKKLDLILRNEGNTQVFTAVHNNNNLGYVAIDSTINSRSCGGLRMLLENDEAETRSSARTMTKVRKTGLN